MLSVLFLISGGLSAPGLEAQTSPTPEGSRESRRSKVLGWCCWVLLPGAGAGVVMLGVATGVVLGWSCSCCGAGVLLGRCCLGAADLLVLGKSC